MAIKHYSDGTYTKGDGKLYYPGVGVVGKDKSTNVSKAESGSPNPVSNNKTNSSRYNTTVTRKNGSTASGYIEDGKSYYSDGTRISSGDSVVDAQGKVWTMGGTDPDAGLSIDDYLAKYGVSKSNKNNTYESGANPYDAYAERMKKEYEERQELIERQNRLAVEQGVNRLNAQKSNINQSADDNARQAYIMHMQQKKALPQQLASQGVSGGATETANLGLASDYQNNVNSINLNRTNALQEIDNAITDLQNTGDLKTVEQVLANNEAALNAYREAFNQQQDYNKWATEFNANRKDTSWEQAYKEQAYKDSMTQQELENQWYERNYSDSKKQEETNRILTMLQNGLVDVNYASTLLGVPANQINNFVDYINKSRQLELNNTQSLISNRKSSGTTRTDSTSNVTSNIKDYLNSGKTTGDKYTDQLTIAQYLVDTDLDVADVLKVAEENGISDIMLARAMKSAGYNNQSIEATIREYYKNNVTDNYINSVLRGI